MRLFAALREIAGSATIETEASTVGGLCDELSERFGAEFARILAAGSVVVDGRTAGADQQLSTGDEVALLPPVSGGSGMFSTNGTFLRS